MINARNGDIIINKFMIVLYILIFYEFIQIVRI
jgi:hypothetical protein